MDWTQLQPLWDWLLPAGWLATALAWWRDRRVRRVREVKETESTYKSLYDDLSTTVVDLSRQLRRINEKTINYETARSARLSTMRQPSASVMLASMLNRCPAVIFLRQQPKGKPDSRPLGQPPCERNRANNLRAGPDADGDDAEGECGTNWKTCPPLPEGFRPGPA